MRSPGRQVSWFTWLPILLLTMLPIMLRIMLLIFLLILLPIGCSRDHRAPPVGVAPPTVEVSWLRPLDGEALADSVRIELGMQADAPAGIEITADGVSIATIEEPPWRIAWLPGGAARRIQLVARAGDGVASTITIDWSPNGAPRVTIQLPRGARGVDRGGVTVEREGAAIERGAGAVERGSPDSLRAEAVDPEEGRLAGAAIRWTSEPQGWLGGGAAIPVDCLVDGAHRIRVIATDRWSRAGYAEVEIEAFVYGDGSTPEGVIEDARHAWLAADPGAYEQRLASSFRFYFCPLDRLRDPAIPVAWDRDEELLSFRAFTRRPGAMDRVAWRVGSVQETTIGGRRMAKAEIETIAIRTIPVEGETLEVAGGRACVYLGRSEGSDRWAIEQWMDRGTEGGVSQGALRMAAGVATRVSRGPIP